MAAVRAKPGPGFTLRAIAGIENRTIQTFGGAATNHQLTGAVGLWASARSVNQLSGLQVTARIIDPNGQLHKVMLNDEQVEEPRSGSYQASFKPKTNGRHQGVIRIENLGHAALASPLRQLLHADGKVDLKAKVSRFVREIPFYFDAGKRKEPDGRIGDEAPRKEAAPRKRRVLLASAEIQIKKSKSKPRPAKR